MHTGNCDGSDPSEQGYVGGITNDQAQELLRSDVASAEQTVNSLVTVPLTQAQFDALVDFTYNVGAGNFERSDLLTKLNAGQYDAVPQELNKWVYGGGEILPGLVTRRGDEGNLFQSEGVAPTNAAVAASAIGTQPSYQGPHTLGERVATTQDLHVRSEPGTSSQVITTEAQGATGMIKDGPTFQDGYWWWQVNFDDGTTGWSADNWLLQAVQPQEFVAPTTQNSESIVGEWRFHYKWNQIKDQGGDNTIHFYDDGGLTSPDIGGVVVTGKWVQSGDTIRFETGKVVSEGTIKMDTMSGTMSATDGMTGYWSATKVGS